MQYRGVPELDVVAANIGDGRDPHAAYAYARERTPVARVPHLGADVAIVYLFAEAEEMVGFAFPSPTAVPAVFRATA